MSKNTRLVATALPATALSGRMAGPPGQHLYLSVALSPQLFMRGDHVQLARHYYEVHHWPYYSAFFRHALRFQLFAFDQNLQNPKPLTYIIQPSAGPAGPELTRPEALQLWQQMLPATTPVSHWQENTLPFQVARKLTRVDAQRKIQDALRDCLDRYTLDAASDPDSGRAQALFRADLEALQGLDITDLLAHPLLQLDVPALKPLLASLSDIQDSIRQELDNLLLRLELTEVYERNLSETGEFHKRFSAYAQHPDLLRQTGWLHDYAFDLSQIVPGSDGNSLGKILKDWQNEKYRVFIWVDPDVFRVDELPNRGGLLQQLRAELPQPMPSLPEPQQDAFWLAFLNELDVSCPLAEVELGDPGDAAPASGSDPWVRSWRVAPRRLETDSADDLAALTNTIFASFREYVTVRNKQFAISSQLVDRKQLFRRIEQLLQNRPLTASTVEARTYEQLRQDAEQQTKLAAHADGYTGNGITLVIENLQTLVRDALDKSPQQQQVIIGQQAATATSSTADQAAGDKYSLKNLLKIAAPIYQHNVHQGYRVDVLACAPGQPQRLYAGSLCLKTERYYDLHNNELRLPSPPPAAGSTGAEQCSSGVHTQEGWVSESVQLGNDASLSVDEELFHWNDWNLVAPLPGLAADDKDDDDPDQPLVIRTAAAPVSQVPLRLLWRYSFALRPVDICGNSAAHIGERLRGDWSSRRAAFCQFVQEGVTADPALADILTSPIVYRRVEGVHQPRIFLYARNPRRWDLPAPGSPEAAQHHEHLTTLVVRSFFRPAAPGSGPAGLEVEPGHIDDVRMLAPPRISLALLQQHGLLDEHLRGLPAPPSRRPDVLTDLLERDAVTWRDEDEPAPVRRIDDHNELDYLCDPLVDGFELLLDANVYTLNLDYAPPESPGQQAFWRGQRYHRLCLRAVPAASAGSGQDAVRLGFAHTPTGAQKETVFSLRPGFSHEVSLGCLLREKFKGGPAREVFLPGITTAYFSPLSRTPTWDAPVAPDPGANAPLTLIHAVEKPCLLYARYPVRGSRAPTGQRAASLPTDPYAGASVWLFHWAAAAGQLGDFLLDIPCRRVEWLERQPASKLQHLQLTFQAFPVLTADTFLLHAYTVDVVSDRRTEQGYRLVVSEGPVQSGLEPARRGIGPADPERETNVVFDNLRHTLPTTRYCRVGYELEAVSKFGAYFPDRLAADARAHSVSGFVFAPFGQLRDQLKALQLPRATAPPAKWLADNFFNEASPCLLPALSTAKPAECVIDKEVPLLHWHHTPGAGAQTQLGGLRLGSIVERTCSTVRIYLTGDWYSTGWGELVAVFFRLLPPKKPAIRDAAAAARAANSQEAKWQWAAEFSSSDSVRFTVKEQEYREQSLSQLISQFGTDPTASRQPVQAGAPIDAAFFQGWPQAAGSVKVGDLEWEQPLYADSGTDLSDQLADLDLHYVLYPVSYASPDYLNREAGYGPNDDHRFQEGKFYVDVPMDPTRLAPYYFPFLRLAIARYQPYSIRPRRVSAEGDECSEHYCFSKVVTTAPFQSLPYRRFSLVQLPQGLAVRWHAGNPTKQYDTLHSNLLVAFIYPAADAVASSGAPRPGGALHQIGELRQPADRPLIRRCYLPANGTAVDLLLNLPPGPPGTVSLAEYEYHDNDELFDEQKQPLPENDDPRLEPRRRLVFSYVFATT